MSEASCSAGTLGERVMKFQVCVIFYDCVYSLQGKVRKLLAWEIHRAEQLRVPTHLHKKHTLNRTTGALQRGIIYLCSKDASPARTTGLVKHDLLGPCLLKLSQARQGQQ